jgi:hypothetical protein
MHSTESGVKLARGAHSHHLIPQAEQNPASHPITPDHTNNIFAISMQDLPQQRNEQTLPNSSAKFHQAISTQPPGILESLPTHERSRRSRRGVNVFILGMSESRQYEDLYSQRTQHDHDWPFKEIICSCAHHSPR